MHWFNRLKLTTKFTLSLSLLLIVLFSIAAWVSYGNQKQLVLRMAQDHSRSIATQIIETRNYMSSVVTTEPETNYNLVPQVVATQVARRISDDHNYHVRQVSLRYRNPENHPDTYETQQLERMARQKLDEISEIRQTPAGQVFRYMQAMKADTSCLSCHGSYEEAPPFVQQRYQPGHFSYNYQEGEVIGAISVVKPMDELYQELGTNLVEDLFYSLLVLLALFIGLSLLIHYLLIMPLRQTSNTIKRITQTGNLKERILPSNTNDEIGQLITGFNTMMTELDRTSLQRGESEQRYRSLIEASTCAVVTFLANGKIVISNHQAEVLLGCTRQQLLGASLFTFVDNDMLLRNKIDNYLKDQHWDDDHEPSHHTLRGDSGQQAVDITLVLASQTDEAPLFTALIESSA